MSATANFFELNQAGMREMFAGMGERPYRATQLMKWMYHRGVIDIDAMTDVSKVLRATLAETMNFGLPVIVDEQHSTDGTRKWLMEVDAQNSIEAVFIPEPDRGTLCVSSQAGCALACTFCSTGRQGFSRNLSTAEIIGQLWLANRQLGGVGARNRVITNVVMMGMGEPLQNFENVVRAMDIMTDDLGFGLGHKRVTLSTAGVVPMIAKLAERIRVSLAISLHAPFDALRDELVPINRHYPLSELMAACRAYAAATDGAPITFEYVMLDGVNDSPEHARQLGALLKGIPAKVNLIPFNPFPDSGYTRSPQGTIDRFREILMNAGLITITRRPRGEDIDAACGQLTGRVVARSARVRARLAEGHA